jgi:hypothetical protein
MATDLEALKQRFAADKEFFNRKSFTRNDFRERFDRRITMKRIDDPGMWHVGIEAVTDYFVGNGSEDRANFETDTVDYQVVDGQGFVSGTGRFTGDTRKAPNVTRRIAYSFAYSSESREWKPICFWGAFIDEN